LLFSCVPFTSPAIASSCFDNPMILVVHRTYLAPRALFDKIWESIIPLLYALRLKAQGRIRAPTFSSEDLIIGHSSATSTFPEDWRGLDPGFLESANEQLLGTRVPRLPQTCLGAMRGRNRGTVTALLLCSQRIAMISTDSQVREKAI
jgi:hypothetical protein